MISRIALGLLSGILACADRPPAKAGGGTSAITHHSSDSAYAEVQQRGHIVMGVDQYTSAHQFESLPDGGQITLERPPGDTAGVAQIRRHMQEIAASFRSGNFAVPGFVHDREVPGTRVMSARRQHISYTPNPTAAGARLRIISGDSSAIAAIHQFLAFQRQDHRAGPVEDGH